MIISQRIYSQSSAMLKILNLGAGQNPPTSTKEFKYTNVDTLELDKADYMQYDITKLPYPFHDEEFDGVYMFHCIEHIEEKHQPLLLREFHRILKMDGRLVLSYPEFKKCAQNYIDNLEGMRDFWKATIYGLQRSKWDFHVTLMDTDIFKETLKNAGFQILAIEVEFQQPFNTVLMAKKIERPPSYEELMGKEFNG